MLRYLRLLLVCAVAVLCGVLASASRADAKTITVGPDLCPAPAEVTVIVGGDVTAVDLNPGRAAADGVLVIYDARYQGWASRRLFSRFILDPRDGRVYGAPAGEAAPGMMCDPAGPRP